MRKIFVLFVICVAGCAYQENMNKSRLLDELNKNMNITGIVIPTSCDGVYGEFLKGYRVMEYDKKNNTRSDFMYFGKPFYDWGFPPFENFEYVKYLSTVGDDEFVSFLLKPHFLGFSLSRVQKSLEICQLDYLWEKQLEILDWQEENWYHDMQKMERKKKKEQEEEERARQAAKEAKILKLHNDLAQKFGTITVTDTIPNRVRQSFRKFINAGGGYDDNVLMEERRYLKQLNSLPKCTEENFLSSFLSSMAWEMLTDDYASFGLEMMGFSGDRGRADMYNALIYSGAITNNCKPEFFYK